MRTKTGETVIRYKQVVDLAAQLEALLRQKAFVRLEGEGRPPLEARDLYVAPWNECIASPIKLCVFDHEADPEHRCCLFCFMPA